MSERVDIDAEEGVATTTRQIGKSGNSFVVRIPPQLLQMASMEKGDRVKLTAQMGGECISLEKFDTEPDE
jgi:antitoxin component of MazEF toxin-antitoxin module